MSQVPIQSAAASVAGPTATTTLGQTPTVGNLLVAAVFARGATTFSFPGFQNLGSVTTVHGPHNDTFEGLFFRYFQAGEATPITVNTPGATQTDLVVVEVPGCTSDPFYLFDQGSSGTSGTSNVTSLSTGTTPTTTYANEIAIAACGQRHSNGAVGSSLFTNGFTLLQLTSFLIVGYKILSGLQTVETTASWVTAHSAGAVVATFVAAPTPPADPFPVGYQPPHPALRS